MIAASAARAFQLRINRTDLPTEDAPVAVLCAAVWPEAKLALERADLADDPQAHSEFFEGLCRWRTHFARQKLSTDARSAAFVVTCAARLVLMDAMNGDDVRVDALEAALGTWRSGARAAELGGLRRFSRPESKAEWREKMVVIASRWLTSSSESIWASCWAECTALILLHDGSAQEADEGFLRMAAEWDADCCMRMVIASQLRDKSVEPSEPVTDELLVAARAWMQAKASQAGESLGERCRETMFRASLAPWAIRRLGQRKARAAFGEFTRDETRGPACARGLRGAGDAELTEEDLGLLLMGCVAYFAEQACSFRLEGRLMMMDNEPAAFLTRIHSHQNERVLGPPPLLLRTHEGSYVAHRTREPGAHDRIERYPSLARAVIAWVRHVHETRNDVLFLDRKLGTFAPALLGRAEAVDHTIRLETVALV